MADQGPDFTPKPKKVYTAEEKAEILRRLRRANMVAFAVSLVIAALGVGLVYVQTQSAVLAGVTAVVVMGYLIYREVKPARNNRD